MRAAIIVAAFSLSACFIDSPEPSAARFQLAWSFDGGGDCDTLGVEIIQDGVKVALSGIPSGRDKRFVLRPGETTVRFLSWVILDPLSEPHFEILGDRTVTLVVGETVEIVWPDTDEDQ